MFVDLLDQPLKIKRKFFVPEAQAKTLKNEKVYQVFFHRFYHLESLWVGLFIIATRMIFQNVFLNMFFDQVHSKVG